ncbi:putative Deflagellation inducible protein; 13 kDa [Paratrimastix pyriformis]|uniref:Deflagellation inducible protein n=1 Tax=Paratrimastix pyriformis TaxID=342808 RepID=A0ABQ8UGR5_9EUKA|nr:putative Deflagellation inducible protein; 13 kDa [Paratrimastix pyriformis]
MADLPPPPQQSTRAPAGLQAAAKGATLHTCNSELVKCIEDMYDKRQELQEQIIREEEEKAKIQFDIRMLNERLQRISESLQRKILARDDYDKTIEETEAAYSKILESSKVLLSVLKRESATLSKKKTGAPEPS